jgi:hypothetical protein
VQDMGDVANGLQSCGKQAADLVAGKPDQAAALCGRGFGGGHDGQESVGQDGQGCPPPPRGPGADLVLV